MKHCCDVMREEVGRTCDEHSDRFECPDVLVNYTPKFDEYGLVVHDGGRSERLISFCPWCGSKLPASKRDDWFDALGAMGIESPFTDPIPEAFQSDSWWRGAGNEEPSSS